MKYVVIIQLILDGVLGHYKNRNHFSSHIYMTFAIRLGFSTPDGYDVKPIIFNGIKQ